MSALDDAAAIPVELREASRYVLWRKVRDGDKVKKEPFIARDPKEHARSNDPATWASLAETLAAFDPLRDDGIGYAIEPGLTLVDLDDVRNGDGTLHPDAAAIVSKLDTYTEWSQSRVGLHCLLRGRLTGSRRQTKQTPWGGELAAWDCDRFVYLTGELVRGPSTAIEQRQAELDDVLAHFLPERQPATRPSQPVELDDRDLLERAFAARNGRDFERLYNGDTSGYASPSEADLAFCRTAAFWTGRDRARIDTWLRSSGLMRDKWERADYRERTLDAAIAATTDVYTPPRARPPAPPMLSDDDAAGDNGKPSFVIETLTGRELVALPDPNGDAQLLGPYVRRGERTIVVGDTGEGKTTIVMQFVRGVLAGVEVLGQVGAGAGPALILDLEQGLRSAKRAVLAAGLHDRDDVHIARCPDGLALDKKSEHVDALRALLELRRPIVVALDPYYKLYEELDPNVETGVVALMRFLDGLRVEFGFALVLSAHPRKDQPGRSGIRKLTIHDVAGSGALTRGAEVVLAIERGNPGYARLRVLKDRDGDLAVGQATALIFNRDEGFRLDPREQVEQSELDRRAVEVGGDGKWRTGTEFATALGVAKGKRTVAMLERLTGDGLLEYEQGPEGRSGNAKCWRATSPDGWGKSGEVGQLAMQGAPSSATSPASPTSYRGRSGSEEVAATPPAVPVSVGTVEGSRDHDAAGERPEGGPT